MRIMNECSPCGWTGSRYIFRLFSYWYRCFSHCYDIWCRSRFNLRVGTRCVGWQNNEVSNYKLLLSLSVPSSVCIFHRTVYRLILTYRIPTWKSILSLRSSDVMDIAGIVAVHSLGITEKYGAYFLVALAVLYPSGKGLLLGNKLFWKTSVDKKV